MTASALAQMSSLTHEAGKHGRVRSALGVWQTNALPSHEDGGGSLYADASLINHSCSPSLEQGFDRTTRAQRLHVTRPMVSSGEHLSIAYINEPGTRAERRRRLRERFGFHCVCPLCSLGGLEQRESDSRQTRMSALRQLILASGRGGSGAGDRAGDRVIAAVEEMLSLQELEGLPLTWGQEYLIIAMSICQKRGDGLAERRAASRFAWGAAEATRIGGHGDARIYEQLVRIAARCPLPTITPTRSVTDGLEAAWQAARAAFEERRLATAIGGRDCGEVSLEIATEMAELSEVHVVRNFLSAAAMAELHQAGTASSDEQQVWPRRRRTAMGTQLHDVRYSDEHVALFLHYDRYLEACWPALHASIVGAMRTHDSAQGLGPLNVRCIEMHRYVPGGGVFAARHRDMGSALTLSVLLSEPTEMIGGEFVTWSEGQPVMHQLARGDAVLLRSEKCHNVAKVMRGVRRSLVVELWSLDTNTKNRYG